MGLPILGACMGLIGGWLTPLGWWTWPIGFVSGLALAALVEVEAQQQAGGEG